MKCREQSQESWSCTPRHNNNKIPASRWVEQPKQGMKKSKPTRGKRTAACMAKGKESSTCLKERARTIRDCIRNNNNDNAVLVVMLVPCP
mmetsp:Transcript_27906/g.42931  ORF Transcript_27906/g.42931 Transcript_27906/m.42931 type:complete len:90 (+) Transcript_27906:216-485(+)